MPVGLTNSDLENEDSELSVGNDAIELADNEAHGPSVAKENDEQNFGGSEVTADIIDDKGPVAQAGGTFNDDNLTTTREASDSSIMKKEPEWHVFQPGEGLESLTAITLPETIYSSLIILPLCTNIGRTAFHRKLISLSLFFCLLANLAIQGFFLRYVYKIYVDNEEEHGQCGTKLTDRNLRIFCILVFTGYCFSEIGETFNMFTFVRNFPTSKGFEPLRLKEKKNEDGETETEFHSGMTQCFKWYCYLTILIPKFGIAVALLTYGTGFVVTTVNDEDLILNAIALGFVLDIDDMAYNYFMTYQMREVVQGLPPVIIQATCATDFNTHYGTFFKAGLLFGFTLFTLNFYCPD